jgi:hypothetical protein
LRLGGKPPDPANGAWSGNYCLTMPGIGCSAVGLRLRRIMRMSARHKVVEG